MSQAKIGSDLNKNGYGKQGKSKGFTRAPGAPAVTQTPMKGKDKAL